MRSNAASAFGLENGARVMLSTPPAITHSHSPVAMRRAASATASSPEPQRRFTVMPGQLVRESLGAIEQGHARDVAVVFPGLVRRAEDDVIDVGRDGGVAPHERLDDVRTAPRSSGRTCASAPA